ncbi:MAG: MBL fold metallo-hydrolase [Parcubacteria group bacterium]|nr:MBL fold metallo-hydrolase [Parcubacteria group bacterium]
MIITYHGAGCVKLVAGETTLALAPVSKESKLKAVSFGADVALVPLNHPDTNGVEQVARGGKEPFIIRGPGEYEISGVTVAGYPSASRYGKEDRINTMYVINFDSMTVLYLGALAEEKLPTEIAEDLESIDVLFVPIGGEGVLDPSEASKLVVSLEPKIVVPIFWGDVGEKDALKKFLKEYGEDAVQPVDKFTIKAKEAAAMEGDVVVIAS